jgi:hypothetical protein
VDTGLSGARSTMRAAPAGLFSICTLSKQTNGDTAKIGEMTHCDARESGRRKRFKAVFSTFWFCIIAALFSSRLPAAVQGSCSHAPYRDLPHE